MREVFVNEYLTNVLSCLAERPGALFGLVQECQEMGDVDYRIGDGEEIKIDETDPIAGDQDVVRFEVTMNQRRWSALQTKRHSLHYAAYFTGQIGASGGEKILRFTETRHVFRQ